MVTERSMPLTEEFITYSFQEKGAYHTRWGSMGVYQEAEERGDACPRAFFVFSMGRKGGGRLSS